MGSTIFPKALISMPQSIQTPSRLGFPVLSFLPSPLAWRRTSISTPSWSRLCHAITLPTPRRSFVVNAEPSPEEGAAEATEESAGEEEDAEETASESDASESEVEERPPRKPRIKLGEIMGQYCTLTQLGDDMDFVRGAMQSIYSIVNEPKVS